MQKDFSYPLNIDDLNQQQQHYVLQADAEQLKTLKEILQVEGVKSFQADVYLKRHLKEHLLDVWGTLKAEIELKSVISLENFCKSYDIPFTYHFDTAATYQDIKDMEMSINDEVPDIVENGQIDLVDMAIEQLALVLDDYPRQEGESFSFESEFDPETTEASKPFAMLAALKK